MVSQSDSQIWILSDQVSRDQLESYHHQVVPSGQGDPNP